MNWDWDKLQEKKNRRQNGRYIPPTPDEEEPLERDSGSKKNERYLLNDPQRGGSNPFQKLSNIKRPKKGLIILGICIIAAVWLLSGIFIVNPDEEGVVLRF